MARPLSSIGTRDACGSRGVENESATSSASNSDTVTRMISSQCSLGIAMFDVGVQRSSVCSAASIAA